MSCVKKCRGCVHELFFPIADLAGVQFVAFTDDGQCVLLFEDFQHNFELEVGGKFALGLAFHTGLNLARYPTYRVVLNMGRTIHDAHAITICLCRVKRKRHGGGYG